MEASGLISPDGMKLVFGGIQMMEVPSLSMLIIVSVSTLLTQQQGLHSQLLQQLDEVMASYEFETCVGAILVKMVLEHIQSLSFCLS